jgi:hypothetical protein
MFGYTFSPEILEKYGYWHGLHTLDGWEKDGNRVKRFGFLGYQRQEHSDKICIEGVTYDQAETHMRKHHQGMEGGRCKE